jgi:hypothetical protein
MPFKWYEGDKKQELDRFLNAYTGGRDWNDQYYASGYDLDQWKRINSKNSITNYIRSDNCLAEALRRDPAFLAIRHASLNREKQGENDTETEKELVFLAVAKGIHQPGKDHFSVLHEGFLYHLSVQIHQPRQVVGARPDPWVVTVIAISKGDRVQDETVGGWATQTGRNTRVHHV